MSEQVKIELTKKEKKKQRKEEKITIEAIPDSRVKNIGKILLKALIVVGIGYLLYLFIPFNYILNLDPLTIDIFFIVIMAVFIILTALVQEAIGSDKVDKEKIKESKEI